MMDGRRTLKFAFAVAAGVAAGSPAFAQEEVTVALPALSLTFSSSYIAEDMGFWKENGLDVKLTNIRGVGAMNAVLSGSVEFSNSSGPSLIRANIRGQKLFAVAGTIDRLQLEIVLAKSVAEAAGITADSTLQEKAQALRGRKIAPESVNSVVHGFIRYVAKKGGVDPDREITIAPTQPPSMPAALKTGAIDGYAMSMPWTIIPVHAGTAVRLVSAPRGDFPELYPFAYNVVATRPGLCEEKPTLCQKLVDGYAKAAAYMHDHPDESKAILQKRLKGIDPEVFNEGFEWVQKSTPRKPVLQAKYFENAQEFMVIGGMIKADEKLESFSEIFTNEFAK